MQDDEGSAVQQVAGLVTWCWPRLLAPVKQLFSDYVCGRGQGVKKGTGSPWAA